MRIPPTPTPPIPLLHTILCCRSALCTSPEVSHPCRTGWRSDGLMMQRDYVMRVGVVYSIDSSPHLRTTLHHTRQQFTATGDLDHNNNGNADSGEGLSRAAVAAAAAGAGERHSTSRGGSRGRAHGGAAGRRGAYSYDPWAAWVLENYSFYTTLLAAFTRKATSMSFKVRPGRSRVGGGCSHWWRVR